MLIGVCKAFSKWQIAGCSREAEVKPPSTRPQQHRENRSLREVLEQLQKLFSPIFCVT